MAETYNEDVKFLDSRARKFRQEAYHCQSNGLAMMLEDDKIRQRSYVQSMRDGILHVQSLPIQDLPESHPEVMELPELPALASVENDICNKLIQHWENFIIELRRSASSRLANALMVHDENRLIKILDRIDSTLNYADTDLPLDLPDSSPSKSVSPPGRGGVAL